MPKNRSSWNVEAIPPSMYRAMGFLIAAAAIAEYHLSTQILRLVSEAHRPFFHAYPLVAGVEAKTKISLIRIFVKMFDIKNSWSVDEILDKISTLFDRRNEIAHSVRLGEMPQPQVRTAKEISTYARQLLKLCDELEVALSQRGVLTMNELRAIELAKLSPEFRRALAQSQSHRPTKRKTRHKLGPSDPGQDQS